MLYNVKAGIIGLEDLGAVYARLINDHIKNLNLLAAYGKTQKELLFAKNELKLEYVYSDEKALIENHDVDLVFIFSEPQQRPHQAIKAIEAGKHVFIANPIALNYEDAKAVKDCASSHPSQVVMANSLVSFNPLLNLVKEDIDKGSIGMINHLSIDSSFMNSINKIHNSNTGSALFNFALDEIELCQWLIDDKLAKINVDANRETLICRASTNNSTAATIIVQPKIKKGQSYLTIYGNNGQIIVSNTNNKSYKLYTETGERKEVYLDNPDRFLYPEYLQLHHFTQTIIGHIRPKVRLDHAVDIIELAIAFEKSKVLKEEVIIES